MISYLTQEDNIEKIFKDMNNIPDFNKIEFKKAQDTSWVGSSRHYYPRITHQNILYEEEVIIITKDIFWVNHL